MLDFLTGALARVPTNYKNRPVRACALRNQAMGNQPKRMRAAKNNFTCRKPFHINRLHNQNISIANGRMHAMPPCSKLKTAILRQNGRANLSQIPGRNLQFTHRTISRTEASGVKSKSQQGIALAKSEQNKSVLSIADLSQIGR